MNFYPTSAVSPKAGTVYVDIPMKSMRRHTTSFVHLSSRIALLDRRSDLTPTLRSLCVIIGLVASNGMPFCMKPLLREELDRPEGGSAAKARLDTVAAAARERGGILREG